VQKLQNGLSIVGRGGEEVCEGCDGSAAVVAGLNEGREGGVCGWLIGRGEEGGKSRGVGELVIDAAVLEESEVDLLNWFGAVGELRASIGGG